MKILSRCSGPSLVAGMCFEATAVLFWRLTGTSLAPFSRMAALYTPVICSAMLYSSEEASVSSLPRDANVYQPFRMVDNAVAEKIKTEFSSSHPDLRKSPLPRLTTTLGLVRYTYGPDSKT